MCQFVEPPSLLNVALLAILRHMRRTSYHQLWRTRTCIGDTVICAVQASWMCWRDREWNKKFALVRGETIFRFFYCFFNGYSDILSFYIELDWTKRFIMYKTAATKEFWGGLSCHIQFQLNCEMKNHCLLVQNATNLLSYSFMRIKNMFFLQIADNFNIKEYPTLDIE